MWLHVRLRQLIVIVLTVVGEECLGVRVSHKSISATSDTRTLILVASWQWIDFKQRKKLDN